MTPAARISAAIDVLDRVLAGVPAEQALTGWARAKHYAGSGDRAAVRDHVFDALRCRRSYAELSGAKIESGRALMIGALRAAGSDPTNLFGLGPYAPEGIQPAEAEALAHAPRYEDLPDAVGADCPDWLEPPLRTSLGPDFLAVMQAQRLRAPVYLRVNLARITRAEVCARLGLEGISAIESPDCDSALIVDGNPNKIKAFSLYLEGFVELQDLSPQRAVAALSLTDGMRILDFCAGGGGKSLAMAARAKVQIFAHDAAPARMRDLPERAARAGCKVSLVDGKDLVGQTYDLVLLDVPCSGSGTWRRTPDGKWRLTPDRLAELVALQKSILQQAAELVCSGGKLAYMTCSLLSVENRTQIDAFLERNDEFSKVVERNYTPLTGGDGFYLAQMSRV